MPFYYTVAGTSLQKINTGGTVTTLSLPTGVTLLARRPRFATLNKRVIIGNSGTVNLMVDARDDAVYPLSVSPPPLAFALAAGSAGSLSGTFKARETFAIKDANGKIITESAYGPETSAVTISSKKLSVPASVPTDTNVNSRRYYRTTTNGAEYFHWFDIDGNDAQTVENAKSDAALSLVAAQTLGNPPGTIPGSRLELLVEWKNRLWAKGFGDGVSIDELWISESNRPYAWKNTRRLPIPPEGHDATGISALIRRRDVLGVARRDRLYAIDNPNPTELSLRKITEQVGVLATDSVVVIEDVAYFLGEDAVYEWSAEGVRNISRDQVNSWFTTGGTFNRAEFPNAVGGYDPENNSYDLHLAAAGGTDLNRWVSFSLRERKWLGPHKTDAFTPTYRAIIKDSNDLNVPIMGSSAGELYTMNAAGRTDDSTAIDFDVSTNPMSANTPLILKLWKNLAILSKIEAAGSLTVTPTIGNLNASAGSALTHDLTTGQELIKRVFSTPGRFIERLRFRQNSDSQDVTIFGFEVDSHELGGRIRKS